MTATENTSSTASSPQTERPIQAQLATECFNELVRDPSMGTAPHDLAGYLDAAREIRGERDLGLEAFGDKLQEHLAELVRTPPQAKARSLPPAVVAGGRAAPNKTIDPERFADLLVAIGEEVAAVRELVDLSTNGDLESDTLMTAGAALTKSTLIQVDAALNLVGRSTHGGFSEKLGGAK